MMKLLFGGAAAAAMLAIAPAIAQIQPAAKPHRADKVHTRAEVQARVAEHFARLDADRDGFVTRAEADAMRAQHAAQFAERRAQRQSQAFDRMDANRDGAISRSEWDAARAQRQAHRADGKDGKMHGRGMRGMGALHGRMFELADANRDNRVSLQEATAAALQHFDTADANRDGQITSEERRQMRQRLRNERRPG